MLLNISSEVVSRTIEIRLSIFLGVLRHFLLQNDNLYVLLILAPLNECFNTYENFPMFLDGKSKTI